VNHKRVYRMYREEGLGVRRRKRKRIGAVERQALAIPVRSNERWSMDFISDALSEGRKFRSLNPSADGWMISIGNAWRRKWTRPLRELGWCAYWSNWGSDEGYRRFW